MNHPCQRPHYRYDSRRASSFTEQAEHSECTQPVPAIFRNALHVAIQHDSIEVLKLLLRYGLGMYFNILSRASEVGSPTNRRDTDQG